jgi:glycosyltransferase involved in cell wall biosynthesis
MSVIFSVNGKFSAFDYCANLNKSIKKLHLITTYPFFHVKKYGLKKSQVTSFFFIELIKRINQKFFLDRGHYFFGNLVENFTNNLFDRLAAKKVNELRYKNFIGFSGSADKSIKLCKKLFIKSFLIRGSSHILEVKKILKSENKKNNLYSNFPYNSLIKNELSEYKNADKIILHSQFAINSFLSRNFNIKKLIYLPLGVYREINLKKKYKKQKIILYLGQVSVRKGIHYLIKAFLKLKNNNFELHIAGPVQNDMKVILDYIDNKKNIFIYGKVSDSKKKELFMKASIFCLPTLEDGFAKVILEALQYRNFLLCSNYSAAPEIIKKYKKGLIVNPRNINNFASKINKSIKLCNRDEPQSSSLKKLNEIYNWNNINKKLVSILDI